MTVPGPAGQPEQVHKGQEICRAGPGNQWLLTDLTLPMGIRTIKIHTVVGYDARRRSYAGSLFDSFGGEPGLLRGEVGTDLEQRTLCMYSGEGTPGFDVRWRMRWVSTDERHTSMERLQDGAWLLVSELVHRRRK